jgi:hypothetical protein
MFTQPAASRIVRRPVVRLKFGFSLQSITVLALMMAATLACATGGAPTDAPAATSNTPASTTEGEGGSASTPRPPTVPPSDSAPVSTQVEAACSCREDRYDCSDFTEPDAAQECYQYCMAEAGSDIHLLDGDGNRVVCESVWPGWATPGAAGPRPTYTPFRFSTSTPRP